VAVVENEYLILVAMYWLVVPLPRLIVAGRVGCSVG
jgi:hypothetical protein